MILLRLAFLLPLLLLVKGALATGSLTCHAIDRQPASIEVNLGHAAVETPTWVRVSAGHSMWSSLAEDTAADGAIPVAIGQFFADESQLLMDVVDVTRSEVVASLRLLRGTAANDYIEAGILALPGKAAFAVTCLK